MVMVVMAVMVAIVILDRWKLVVIEAIVKMVKVKTDQREMVEVLWM